MIQLHRDYLLVKTPEGSIIPCSAELIAVELVNDCGGLLDSELVRHAAAAVLHYFGQDLGWKTVSLGEFSNALEQALKALGVTFDGTKTTTDRAVATSDLCELARSSGRALELIFFQKLRDELRTKLGASPQTLRFHGLRRCVKELIGARRWNHRCQDLNDRIVEFLRDCLKSEAPAASCELVIR